MTSRVNIAAGNFVNLPLGDNLALCLFMQLSETTFKCPLPEAVNCEKLFWIVLCVFKFSCSAIFFMSYIVVFSGAWIDIFSVIKYFCYEKAFSAVMKQSITTADLSELAGLYSSPFEKVNLYHLLVFPDKWALKGVCKQQQSPGLLAEPLVSKGLVSFERNAVVPCRSRCWLA